MARPKRPDRSAAEMVAALLVFHDEMGRWPTATELEPSILRARGHVEALARYERLNLPGAGSLRNRFGSFVQAIESAELALAASTRAGEATETSGKGAR